MKTKHLVALMALVWVFLGFGCSKNTAKPTQTPAGKPYNMSAKINGTSWSRDSCLYHIDLIDTTSVDIVGWAGYPKTRPDYFPQVYIWISHYKGVGSYSSASINGTLSGEVWLSDTNKEGIRGGTVTITATSPKMTGTFSITTDSLSITDGTFTAQKD
jgi:hypothetical protein